MKLQFSGCKSDLPGRTAGPSDDGNAERTGVDVGEVEPIPHARRELHRNQTSATTSRKRSTNVRLSAEHHHDIDERHAAPQYGSYLAESVAFEFEFNRSPAPQTMSESNARVAESEYRFTRRLDMTKMTPPLICLALQITPMPEHLPSLGFAFGKCQESTFGNPKRPSSTTTTDIHK